MREQFSAHWLSPDWAKPQSGIAELRLAYDKLPPETPPAPAGPDATTPEVKLPLKKSEILEKMQPVIAALEEAKNSKDLNRRIRSAIDQFHRDGSFGVDDAQNLALQINGMLEELGSDARVEPELRTPDTMMDIARMMGVVSWRERGTLGGGGAARRTTPRSRARARAAEEGGEVSEEAPPRRKKGAAERSTDRPTYRPPVGAQRVRYDRETKLLTKEQMGEDGEWTVIELKQVGPGKVTPLNLDGTPVEKKPGPERLPAEHIVDIPFAEGDIILSFSYDWARRNAALENVSGTQGAHMRGQMPTLQLSNKRGLDAFVQPVIERDFGAPWREMNQRDYRRRALAQAGITVSQTPDGTRLSIGHIPDNEWIVVNGRKIFGKITSVDGGGEAPGSFGSGRRGRLLAEVQRIMTSGEFDRMSADTDWGPAAADLTRGLRASDGGEFAMQRFIQRVEAMRSRQTTGAFVERELASYDGPPLREEVISFDPREALQARIQVTYRVPRGNVQLSGGMAPIRPVSFKPGDEREVTVTYEPWRQVGGVGGVHAAQVENLSREAGIVITREMYENPSATYEVHPLSPRRPKGVRIRFFRPGTYWVNGREYRVEGREVPRRTGGALERKTTPLNQVERRRLVLLGQAQALQRQYPLSDAVKSTNDIFTLMYPVELRKADGSTEIALSIDEQGREFLSQVYAKLGRTGEISFRQGAAGQWVFEGPADTALNAIEGVIDHLQRNGGEIKPVAPEPQADMPPAAADTAPVQPAPDVPPADNPSPRDETPRKTPPAPEPSPPTPPARGVLKGSPDEDASSPVAEPPKAAPADVPAPPAETPPPPAETGPQVPADITAYAKEKLEKLAPLWGDADLRERGITFGEPKKAAWGSSVEVDVLHRGTKAATLRIAGEKVGDPGFERVYELEFKSPGFELSTLAKSRQQVRVDLKNFADFFANAAADPAELPEGATDIEDYGKRWKLAEGLTAMRGFDETVYLLIDGSKWGKAPGETGEPPKRTDIRTSTIQRAPSGEFTFTVRSEVVGGMKLSPDGKKATIEYQIPTLTEAKKLTMELVRKEAEPAAPAEPPAPTEPATPPEPAMESPPPPAEPTPGEPPSTEPEHPAPRSAEREPDQFRMISGITETLSAEQSGFEAAARRLMQLYKTMPDTARTAVFDGLKGIKARGADAAISYSIVVEHEGEPKETVVLSKGNRVIRLSVDGSISVMENAVPVSDTESPAPTEPAMEPPPPSAEPAPPAADAIPPAGETGPEEAKFFSFEQVTAAIEKSAVLKKPAHKDTVKRHDVDSMDIHYWYLDVANTSLGAILGVRNNKWVLRWSTGEEKWFSPKEFKAELPAGNDTCKALLDELDAETVSLSRDALDAMEDEAGATSRREF